MGNITSVKVSENGQRSEVTNDGISTYKGEETGRMVPLDRPIEAETHSIKINDNESSGVDSTRVTRVVGTVPSAVGDGALATIRSEADMPISDPADVNPRCSITLDGKYTMSIASAMQLGYLRKTGGEYQVVGSPMAELQKNREEKAKDPTDDPNVKVVDFTDDVSKANITALSKASSQQTVHTFATELISAMVDGRECDTLIANFCSKTKATDASVVEAMENMFNSQLENVSNYLEQRYGLDSGEFIEYFTEKAPKAVQKQIMLSAYYNDLKGIDFVVKQFKAKRNL